jgi:hypothetical protein
MVAGYGVGSRIILTAKDVWVMAVREILVDDLDGSEAVETISFGIDGQGYEIDLNAEHAKALRENLADYIEVARRIRAGKQPAAKPTRKPQSSRDESTAIREWARARGHEIADRGRIPGKIVEAYRAER